jgi:hypothetical protein
VIANQGLQDDGAPWIKVAASEWNDGIADYVAPDNVIIVGEQEPAPPGADQVVFYSITAEQSAKATSGDG